MADDQNPQEAATDAPETQAAAPVDDGPQSAEDAVSEALGLSGDEPAATAEDTPADAKSGQPRDEHGKFAKADATPEPSADAPVAPEVAKSEAPKPPDAKPADPDAVPEGLSEKAQERFQSLAKERNDWRDRASQWQQTIQSTGADAKQFGEMLEYVRMVNSGDPTQLRGALETAKRAVRDLSVALGEDTQTVDAVGAYPDLVQRVQNGDIDRRTAMELVRAREQAQALQQQQQTYAQSQQEERSIQAATQQLDQLGQQLRAQDPDFPRKFEAMRSFIPVIAENQPPAQWAASFLRAYQGLQLPPAIPAAQPLRPTPQPLHGVRTGGNNLRPEPKTAEEAVAQALGLTG